MIRMIRVHKGITLSQPSLPLACCLRSYLRSYSVQQPANCQCLKHITSLLIDQAPQEVVDEFEVLG